MKLDSHRRIRKDLLPMKSVSEKETMVKKELNDVGKSDANAIKRFDPKLYHILTTVTELELDSTHSKYRDIFANNNMKDWEDFYCDEIDDFGDTTNLKYTNEQGNVIEIF